MITQRKIKELMVKVNQPLKVTYAASYKPDSFGILFKDEDADVFIEIPEAMVLGDARIYLEEHNRIFNSLAKLARFVSLFS